MLNQDRNLPLPDGSLIDILTSAKPEVKENKTDETRYTCGVGAAEATDTVVYRKPCSSDTYFVD
jgi:hypothetical protein